MGLRVLHVVWNFDQGGLERFVHELARRIDSSRVETHVLSLGTLGHFAQGLEGYATLHLAKPMHKLSLLYPRALMRQIKAIGPDVVHTHSGAWYKAARAARGAGVPVVIHTDHGRESGGSAVDRIIERRAARLTNVVVAVAPWLAELNARQFDVRRDRLQTIPNGVDTARFNLRNRTPRPDGLPAHRTIIVSTGRFVAVKSFSTMIRAMAILLNDPALPERPALVLIGDGPLREDLEREAKSYGIEQYVHFLGWVEHVERYLAHAKIFTLSSVSEGTSMSLLEAMSSGALPVVTNVGGNADVLGLALADCLVPPNDPAALAKRWRAALVDEQSTMRCSAIATHRARSEYDLQVTVARYLELYESTYASVRG